MNQNTLAVAKDNTLRVSPLKLSYVVKMIVNQKVDKAVNQLKFSQKRSIIIEHLNSLISRIQCK